MLRRLSRNSFYLVSVLPFGSTNPYDVDSTKDEQRESKKKSGWERLYFMYSLDEFGGISPELTSALQATYLGVFGGAVYGGILFSRTAYFDFLDRNEASTFKSHLDAKRKLQDAVTKGFAKGAFMWSWRLGLFSGSFVLLTTSISVYRGKSSILEYFVSGALIGSMARISLGLRGMLVGGILGSALGGFAGALSIAILKMGGFTMEDIRYWQYKWKEERKDQWREIFKSENKKDNPLLEFHDAKLEPEEKTLDAVDRSDASNLKPKPT